MKYFLISLSLLLCYSCSNPINWYTAKIPTIHPDSIRTQMLPVSVGNYWTYEINYIQEGIKDTFEVKVLSLDTVHVYVNNRDTTTLAYKLNWNKNLSSEKNTKYFYYFKSETQTQVTQSREPEPKTIKWYYEIIYEEPGINMIDPDNPDRKWVGKRFINTKYGKKYCYYIESTINDYISKRREDDLVYQICTYYLKGVGEIREECYNSKGKVIIEKDLIDYKVK